MAGVDIQEWQGRVGQSWATEWQRTDRSFAELTAEIRARVLALEFSQVLDIGCGAGELSLLLAGARTDAKVLGVDVSPQLIEVARQRGAGLPNLQFELADASQWQSGPGAEPDLLVSRHGVMFFDDPVAAFVNLERSARAGARMVFSCFRGLEFNPLFAEAGRLVPIDPRVPAADPLAPGPFAFAESSRVERILANAGWGEIAIEAFDFATVVGSGEDPVNDAVEYFSRIGPAAQALAQMGDVDRVAMLERIEGLAQAHLRDGVVALGASAWIVSASAS